MTCSACGGDGLIEVGAYRGDEGSETRECRLCGGVVTTDGPIEKLARAATQAGVSVHDMSRALAAASPSAGSMPEYTQLQSGDFQRAARIANEYASRPPTEPRSPKLHDNDTLQRADRVRAKWNKR